MLRLLDRHRADQQRLPTPLAIGDGHDDRRQLLGLRAIDFVVLVDARNRPVGRDLDHVEPVDVHELVGLGIGRAGHAGELVVEAEIVLEGDRGQRLVLGLDGHALLGFERLMQAFRVAPTGHHATRELVDDDDLVGLDDVVLVALEQLVRLERLIDVMHHSDVLDVVERAALEHAGFSQQLLDALVAGLGQRHLTLLLVEFEILGLEPWNERVDGHVQLGAVLDRAGDDERRACLVDQDRVDLVDDGEGVAALDHLRLAHLHVVAQVVEAQLVVGRIGDVAGVHRLALLVVEAVHDGADGEAEELVDATHPLGVAAGEIVVDGDDMHRPGEGIEIDRQRCDQRLAFAGLHFGDIALVQHHAADQLHIEVALAERTLGSLADGRERRRQQIVERLFAGRDLRAKHFRAGAQIIVGQLGDFGFQRVDRLDTRAVCLDAAFVGRAEEFRGERAERHHAESSSNNSGPQPRGRSPSVPPPPRVGSYRVAAVRRCARSRAISGRLRARERSRLSHCPRRGTDTLSTREIRSRIPRCQRDSPVFEPRPSRAARGHALSKT